MENFTNYKNYIYPVNDFNGALKINSHFISIILQNLENKEIKSKILPFYKNKQLLKFYLLNLVRFSGEWRLGDMTDIHLVNGEGTFRNSYGICSGKWENYEGAGEIRHHTGVKYKGTISVLLPQTGKGSFIMEGNIFTGEWKELTFEGSIINIKNKDYIYKGSFLMHDNTPITGEGVFVKNDKIFEGIWHKQYGEGRIYSTVLSKDYYFSGKWNEMFYEGRGYIVEDNNVYKGAWTFADEKDCEGEIFPIKGSEFDKQCSWKGRWDKYLWPTNGNGTIISSNNSIYKGEWKDGIGEGRVSSFLGDKEYTFIGKRDKYGLFISGQGSVVDLENKIFQGVWEKDTGEGKIIFPNGKELEAKWDMFKRISQGDGIYYDKDNRKYVGTIRDGNGKGTIISLGGFEFNGTWDINGNPLEGKGVFISKGILFNIAKNSDLNPSLKSGEIFS